MNLELLFVQVGFRKGRGARGQIANILWIIGKAREFQKNIYFCFIDYTKPLTMCITENQKILFFLILKELGILDHLTCLLRNLYATQVTIGIRHGTISNLERSMSRLYIVTTLFI